MSVTDTRQQRNQLQQQNDKQQTKLEKNFE